MLNYTKVAVIDHDWSLYVISGVVGHVRFNKNYAIIHDEDIVDPEFLEDFCRVAMCLINKTLGKRLEAYYE